MRNNRGFTLIEVAIVLVVLGMLLGMGTQMLPVFIKHNKLKENRQLLLEVKTALIGYALANGKLPNASTNTNGLANPGRVNGYLPWATLGMRATDPYTKTLFYAVDSHLTNTTSVADFKSELKDLIDGTTPPDLYCDSGTTPSTPVYMAFIVISGGENMRADSPNDDNNNRRIDPGDNNPFASPSAPVGTVYDDVMQASELSYLSGLMTLATLP